MDASLGAPPAAGVEAHTLAQASAASARTRRTGRRRPGHGSGSLADGGRHIEKSRASGVEEGDGGSALLRRAAT
eukprot:scaffold16092_cov103-Phaeocystis_antarctica.AAC.1